MPLSKRKKLALETVDKFHDIVKRPYSDARWAEAAKLFGLLGTMLSTEERQTLGVVWRDSYSHDVSDALERAVHFVKMSIRKSS